MAIQLVCNLQSLNDDEALPKDVIETLGGDFETLIKQQAIQRLLDQHGTGRILFRKTIQAVKGFPDRILNAYPLELDPNAPQTEVAEENIKHNPAVTWLSNFLDTTRDDKTLIICRSAELALTLEAYLRLRLGFRTAAFYEGLNIIERDRAAAYFADKEEGAQALICSEICSEGRHF